jgi:hypothetical protein
MSSKPGADLNAIELTQAELDSVAGGDFSIRGRLSSIVKQYNETEKLNASAWS